MSAQAEPPGADPVAEVLGSLRIERGHPEPEELAALTVVLARIRTVQPVPVPPEPASSWSDRRHVLGLPPVPGAGGWRASGLPR
ncbi:acyl-CoA carboxylase subunit epsilon [Kineococcus rubinsiae]|uniref:acyl-CoA carboxylase subunit epsilon n=1 Tax=Kineococcus rubinsiae TaxID=2609562 RepID=UPI0014316167|nr:acyl-CoA carboxylase subunit epsilon [Kineococcus rubinsiae]NIZ91224.1 acyl-CoA carboxylase subunit epsilon [Kineococcus rubinsiae]